MRISATSARFALFDCTGKLGPLSFEPEFVKNCANLPAACKLGLQLADELQPQ